MAPSSVTLEHVSRSNQWKTILLWDFGLGGGLRSLSALLWRSRSRDRNSYCVGRLWLVMFNWTGFLSTEDSSAPGNYAILDLVAALQWIKENIAAFAGDADQVSLLGHGYGAALVNILLVSPITKGITSSALALHCVKAHSQSQWRSPNFNSL